LAIRRRYREPTLEQIAKMNKMMIRSYCISTAFGSGLVIGAAVLYSWPMAWITFLLSAADGHAPKGF
jgi:hypothetical protein